MNLKWLIITCVCLTFLFLGSPNIGLKNSRKYIMVEENKGEGSLNNNEADLELALEAFHELPEELFTRYVESFNESFTEEEQKQKRKEVLKEMDIQVNEIYRRKKQERSNQ